MSRLQLKLPASSDSRQDAQSTERTSTQPSAALCVSGAARSKVPPEAEPNLDTALKPQGAMQRCVGQWKLRDDETSLPIAEIRPQGPPPGLEKEVARVF